MGTDTEPNIRPNFGQDVNEEQAILTAGLQEIVLPDFASATKNQTFSNDQELWNEFSAFIQKHYPDNAELIRRHAPLAKSMLRKQSGNIEQQAGNELAVLESKIANWLTKVDYTSIRSASDLELKYLQQNQNSKEKKLIEENPQRFEKLFTEAFRKTLNALEQRVDTWIKSAKIDLTKITSADALKTLYLQKHPQDKALLNANRDRFDRVFARAYKAAEQQEKKEVDGVEKRITTWISQQQIDVTKVKSGDDLKRLYLQKHPQDKARCDAHKNRFDPLFAAAHKKALEAYEAKKKEAKTHIAKATNTLLRPVDIENESLKSQALFIAAMLAQLQHILMQHRKPDALYKELETYAKILIEKLHAVWQSKHEALKNKTMKEELSQIEKAIGSWKPPANKQLANFTEFRSAFLQGFPYKEILKKHEAFSNALLKLKWEQYSLSQNVSDAKSSQSPDQSVAITSTSQSVQARLANLQPEVAAAATSESQSAQAELANLRPEVAAALTSFLQQNQLRVGNKRALRLAQSGKITTLLSGRQDQLAPFLIAMCGLLDNEGEIQRCIREAELSDSPKDTVRIIFASSDCRDAAQKVRQCPLVWTRFSNFLSSVGVSLQDVHLQLNDEERSEQDIQTEMVQEVVEDREDLEVEERDADVSSVENEEKSEIVAGGSNQFVELEEEAETIEEGAEVAKVTKVVEDRKDVEIEEETELNKPQAEVLVLNRNTIRNNLIEAGLYKEIAMAS